MKTKIISIVLVLFVFYENVVPKTFEQTVPEIRRVYAIGWKEYPFPTDLKKMEDICKKFQGAAGDTEFIGDIISYYQNSKFRESFRKEILELLKAGVPSKICRMIQDKDKEILGILKDINSKADKLIPFRDNFAKVNAEAAKPDTKVTIGQYSCWIKNWRDDKANVYDGKTKEVVKEHLSVFSFLLRNFKPDEKCPWPDRKAKPEEIKNLELNYLKAASNILVKTNTTKTN